MDAGRNRRSLSSKVWLHVQPLLYACAYHYNRKKLKRNLEATATTASNDQARSIVEPESDAQSFVHIEMVVPPWAEGNELQAEGQFHSLVRQYSLTRLPGEQSLDDFSDDKLRRVRHELQDGDIIEAVCTVTRIVGVDSSRKQTKFLVSETR